MEFKILVKNDKGKYIHESEFMDSDRAMSFIRSYAVLNNVSRPTLRATDAEDSAPSQTESSADSLPARRNALEKYIDDLVNDRESQDDFPKNESSWEELYDLCGKLIAEIVTLRRKSAQHSVHPTNGGLCAECGSPQWCHSVIGHDFVPPPPAGNANRSALTKRK